MYAIVEMGGKQYQVEEGAQIQVDLIKEKKKGDKLLFDKVLMLSGETYQVGKPYIENAKVSAIVTNMGTDGEGVKDRKIRVFKKKRRKGYHKTIGHRQRYTQIRIDKITN